MSIFNSLPAGRAVLIIAALVPCGALLTPGQVHAGTRTVSNCNDSGAGSLRAAAAAAASGDTIDLSHLSCTRITLTSGQIVLPQDSIRLLGRDRLALTLFGNRSSRVLRHRGTGTLTVERLTVSYGRLVAGEARGGCIASTGNITFRQSRAHHCVAEGSGGLDPVAIGGAIQADGKVVIDRSSVFENRATTPLWQSVGGGVSSGGKTTLLQSQVYNNHAGWGGGVEASNGFRMAYSILQGNTAENGYGGGADVLGDAEINKSTVSGNHASVASGGLHFSDGSTGDSVAVIADSTISGNSGARGNSAIAFVSAEGEIYNSTITANHEGSSGEMCVGTIFGGVALRMESTVVAGNSCDGFDHVDIGDLPSVIGVVTGSHNIVGGSTLSMPPDTIFSDTPGLGPLAHNGGPTRTHAVLSGSILIDRGNNVLNRAYDQRGAPYPRVRGTAPDVGAFER
jgi:hypothetical protein